MSDLVAVERTIERLESAARQWFKAADRRSVNETRDFEREVLTPLREARALRNRLLTAQRRAAERKAAGR